jgi:glyoxalase family protein
LRAIRGIGKPRRSGSLVALPAIERAPAWGRRSGASVHHIAFRATDDAAQRAIVRRLAERHGIRTTDQKDRNYFRSVYFREPGGVLFEIATDGPGFAADEPVASLGTALKLPPLLEPR